MGVRMLITREYTSTEGNPRIAELTEQDGNTLRLMGWTAGLEDARYVHTWEGCVLQLRERNMRDDSDFYALVWDAEKGVWPRHSGNIHPDDVTMKLMEIAHEWKDSEPQRSEALDGAVGMIDDGNLEQALVLVKRGLR